MRASGTNWYSTSILFPLPRGLRTICGVAPWCRKRTFGLLTILRGRFALPVLPVAVRLERCCLALGQCGRIGMLQIIASMSSIRSNKSVIGISKTKVLIMFLIIALVAAGVCALVGDRLREI